MLRYACKSRFHASGGDGLAMVAARCRRNALTRDAAESAKVNINVEHWSGVGVRTGYHLLCWAAASGCVCCNGRLASECVYVDNLNIFPYLLEAESTFVLHAMAEHVIVHRGAGCLYLESLESHVPHDVRARSMIPAAAST